MKKKRLCLLVVLGSLVFLLITANCAFAKTVIFQREYTYQASEVDSKITCRTIAVEQVKRLLLEELGTYLESVTEVRNFQLSKDQITTLTAGIVRTEIVDEKWDGKKYWLKAKIAADRDQVVKSLDALRKNRERVKELEAAREKANKALAEVERLKKELAEARARGKTDIKKQRQYAKTVNDLGASYWLLLGFAYDSTNLYDDRIKAIDAFNMAIRSDPNMAEAYHGRGIVYGRQGHYKMSFADFNKTVQLDPNNAWAYYNLGTLYPYQRKYEKAIVAFDRALELDPSIAMAYRNRGLCYFEVGRSKLGLADIKRSRDPKAEVEYTNRGTSYLQKGLYSKAIEQYDKALEIDPGYTPAYCNRGLAYAKRRQYDKAVVDYNKALQLNPQHATTYHNRGVAYLRLGYKKQATRDLQAAARLGYKAAQDYLSSNGIGW